MDNIKIILTEIDYAIKCGTNSCDIEDYVNNLIEENFISTKAGRKILECYGIISERELI